MTTAKVFNYRVNNGARRSKCGGPAAILLGFNFQKERDIIVGKRLIAFALCLLLNNMPSLQAAQVLFTPALVLSEGYTDNLFIDYQDEVYDFTTAAGLDLTALITSSGPTTRSMWPISTTSIVM
jgi:hypothetical protein